MFNAFKNTNVRLQSLLSIRGLVFLSFCRYSWGVPPPTPLVICFCGFTFFIYFFWGSSTPTPLVICFFGFTFFTYFFWGVPRPTFLVDCFYVLNSNVFVFEMSLLVSATWFVVRP